MEKIPLTHSEKTIRIAKVCKAYNLKTKDFGEKWHKHTPEEREKLDAFLKKECKANGLDYKGTRAILQIN